jgi:L-alanine-DL-glutamate epimerase-like enolase superfamily enzyme
MLGGYLGFASSGAETRAGSAVDIALWDLWGKATNQSVLQLLGGAVRDKIRVYNTCAGYTYNSRGGRRLISADSSEQSAEGPYEDQIAFMKRPAELAHSLLEMGISAMKIWPFDPLAEATGGQSIARGDLAKGVAPFKAIRDALGDRMDIMCELHSIWSVPAALEIAAALRDVGIYWAEDPIKMVNAQALADYRRQAGIRVCASETLATRYGFRELLEKDAVDYVMIDLSWCGGLTESKKIATQAETFQRPIAPHDCTGPVVLIASLALALNAPNAIFQEVVRAYYTGWYTELVTTLPRIDQGFAYPMAGPGLGTALLPGLKARADVSVRRSELQ